MSDPIPDAEISAATPPPANDWQTKNHSERRRHRGSFISNVRWQLVGSISQAILGGLALLLMGRQLGATGFGVFSIIMGVVYLANAMLEPRMQDVAAKQFWGIQSEEFELDDQNQYFVDLLILETVGKLIPCLAVICLASIFTNVSRLPADTAFLFVIAALGYYLARFGYGLTTGLLRVLGRSDLFALCTTAEVFIRILMLGIALGFSRFSVETCILIVAFSGVSANALQWWFITRQSPFRVLVPEWTVRGAVARTRHNTKLIASNLGMSVTDLMNKDLDVTLISTLMPAGEVGIYKMAKNITLLAWRTIDPFYIALMPEISRMVAQSRYSDLRHLMVKTSASLCVLAMCLSVGAYVSLIIFGDAMLGEAFAQVRHLLPWMMIGVVLSAPLVWGHPLAVALDCADIAFFGSLTGAIVGLTAFFLLAPAQGVVGASLAWVASFVLSFLSIATVTLIRLQKRTRALA